MFGSLHLVESLDHHHKACLVFLDGIESVVPRVQALGCHVHFAQPLSASSWRQNSLTIINGCAWGFARLTRKSIEPILASFDHISRTFYGVLNHRICDKKHKHGRLFDLSSESSLQFPKSLCQTLAKQFLVKDRWQFWAFWELLHPDEDERTPIPSASSHEPPMEVDREVDVPPPALPPPALTPPAPLVVDAGPNSSERKEITNWLKKGSSTDWSS